MVGGLAGPQRDESSAVATELRARGLLHLRACLEAARREAGSLVCASKIAGISAEHTLEILPSQPSPQAPAAVLLGGGDERRPESLLQPVSIVGDLRIPAHEWDGGDRQEELVEPLTGVPPILWPMFTGLLWVAWLARRRPEY